MTLEIILVYQPTEFGPFSAGARVFNRSVSRIRSAKTGKQSVLLVFIALCFAANDLIAVHALAAGPRAWQPLALLAVNFLMVGNLWVDETQGIGVDMIGLSVLLGIIALAGFGATVAGVKNLTAMNTLCRRIQ